MPRLASVTGLVLLFLGTVSCGYAADARPAASAPERMWCRSVHFPTNLLPAFSGHEDDIPNTISCLLEVHPTLAPFVLVFSDRGKLGAGRGLSKYRWRVGISPLADPAKQQPMPVAEFPRGCGLEVADFNFDGYTDIALPRDFTEGDLGAFKECWHNYLLFEPATAAFVQNEALSALSGLSFDAASKEVKSYSDDGRAGALYTAGIYRFEGGDLVLHRRERRRWDDATRCLRRTVEERRDGAMQVVRDEVVGESTSRLYEADEWELLDVLPANMGRRLRGIRVLALRSRPDPTKEEYDQRYRLDVLVVQGNDVLYRFSRDKLNPPAGVGEAEALLVERGFLDARMELKDVTNDGVPEVLFISGVYTGLNEVTLYHVIHCNGATRRCWDARHSGFITCRRQEFRWLEWRQRVVAVHARPVCDETCDFRYCAAPFEFVAYGWDAAKERFVVAKSLKTTERLTEDGIDANRRYVDQLLRELTGGLRPRTPGGYEPSTAPAAGASAAR
jgi:hypothetical protein